MAKDPAILFYTSDFISGTITMSHEQRGKYILLLCIQHQKGYLTEKDMLNICNSYDEDIWCKFKKEGENYYNERMRNEAEKRANYAESRRNNRKKKEPSNNEDMKNISFTYDKHMENENVNINKDINKEGGTGETKPKKDPDIALLEKLQTEPLLVPVVYDWLKYKRTRGERYKSDKSVSLFISNLTKYSGGEISKARQIIEQSMANNWAGIFELKKQVSFGTPKPEMEVNSKWGRKSNIK